MKKNGKKTSISKISKIITYALSALIFMKEKNFYHDFIKPSNILIKNSLKIGDFGIACLYDD